jgi:hypothetical protein
MCNGNRYDPIGIGRIAFLDEEGAGGRDVSSSYHARRAWIKLVINAFDDA